MSKYSLCREYASYGPHSFRITRSQAAIDVLSTVTRLKSFWKVSLDQHRSQTYFDDNSVSTYILKVERRSDTMVIVSSRRIKLYAAYPRSLCHLDLRSNFQLQGQSQPLKIITYMCPTDLTRETQYLQYIVAVMIV